MKNLFLLLMICSLMACQSSESLIDDPSKVLVTVGDSTITEQYLQAYILSLGIQQPNKEQIDQALDVLIKQKSLVVQAEKDGLQISLLQQLAIKQKHDQALAQLVLDTHLAANPVSDEAVKAEYDRIVGELKGEEFKVHHLLYKDELQAFAALDEIEAGKSFQQVEASYLAQSPGIKNVGDIGWVNLKQVPESFSQPLLSMQAGDVYPEILLSRYGVHVLYLENIRQSKPPKFSDVQAGIKKTLEQQIIDRYQQLMQVKAKVVLQP